MGRRLSLLAAVGGAAVCAGLAGDVSAQAQRFRTPPPGINMAPPAPRLPPVPTIAPHLRLAHLRAPRDLLGYRVVNRTTGAVFNVYYDEAARAEAERRIPMLDAMVTEVAALSLVDPSEVIWGAAVFAPGHEHVHGVPETRWGVQTDAAGRVTAEGERMLFGTLPHEQAHAAQKSRQSRLPRWFGEGHASWVGLKVTRRLNPKVADEWRGRAVAAADAPDFPNDLRTWGGVRVTGDMIRAQLPPEERARMDRDPNYRPTGSFEFKMNETLSDESQTLGRYGAALRVFEALEEKAGRAKMDAWVRAAWSHPTAPTTADLTAWALTHTGQDITAALGPAQPLRTPPPQR